MLKRLSLFFFVLTAFSFARAGKSSLSFKAGTWSFSTANISNLVTESSGTGAYAAEYGYGVSQRFLLMAGINVLFSDIITGSSGYGIDAGVKYFPLTDIGTMLSESGGAVIAMREVWRPYVGFFLRQRTFNLAISSGYAGPGVSLGLDYAPIEDWYFSLEFRRDLLFGPGNAQADQTNIMLGIGLEI